MKKAKATSRGTPHPFGPAMSKLTPLQQRFVERLLDEPIKSHQQCLRDAGYKGTEFGLKIMCVRLMKNPLVLDARMEAARAKMADMVPPALSMMQEIISNPKHKQHFKAIDSLLDRAGFGAIQKVESHTTVTHQLDRSELITAISSLLERNRSAIPVITVTPELITDDRDS